MATTKPNVKEIAEKYQVSPKEVLDIYYSVFEFIRKHINKINFNDITEEEFKKMKTSFTVPGLGRLHTRYDKIEYIKKNKNGKNVEDKEN